MQGADAELVLGEDHPLAGDPAQLGLAELGAVGHDRARPRDRDRLALRDVGRAADDLRDVALPHRDRADRQPISVGMLGGGQHAADDEVVLRADTVVQDAAELGARHLEAMGELVETERRARVLVEPLERKPHPNCSRKRRSLS